MLAKGRGGEWLDVPALVRLVEREDVGNLVVLLGVGYVVGPAGGAPVLVGVEEGDVFKARDGSAIDDGLPIVHPGDLVVVLEGMSIGRSSDAVVLLGEGK